MHILCFDYGTKYIGVAEAVDQTTAAKSLDPLIVGRGSNPIRKIVKLVKDTKPDLLLFGNPTGLDNKPTQISIIVADAADKISKECNVDYKLWNETYTSKQASDKRNAKDRRIHSEAARIILQEYLDFLTTGI